MNEQVSKWQVQNCDKPASAMTKREMIAAMAMQGLLANKDDSACGRVAQWAVKYADELLAESAYSSIYDTAPEVEQEPFIWLVLNGVVVIRSYYDKTKAEVFANEMQKTHDLSGSLASFSVMPVYTNPQPNQLEQHLELVKPEPVAYRWWNQGCNCDECDQYFYSEDPDFISKNREPLYTTPPTREPLSEDVLMIMAEECTTQFFNGVHQNATIHFARAVEQAHGIGVE